jgi:hypothetical protein
VWPELQKPLDQLPVLVDSGSFDPGERTAAAERVAGLNQTAANIARHQTHL